MNQIKDLQSVINNISRSVFFKRRIFYFSPKQTTKILPMFLPFVVNAIVAAALFNNIHNSFRNTSKEWRKYYKHYFIVMSTLIILDNTFAFILYKIPYYQIFKVLMLGWLSVPLSTGPHFVYNVYIKNIHKLFEGDIDSVIKNFKEYIEFVKAKYYEIVNSSKKGQIEIGFDSRSKLEVPKKPEFESSEVDVSDVDISDNEKIAENEKEE
jgi:receptor expression-enhancing protein 1/2/3/4